MTEYCSNPLNLTVQGNPVVVIENYFGFSNYPIRATFDFSKIPTFLHGSMLNAILNDHNKRTKPISQKQQRGWLYTLLNLKIC